LGKYGFFKELLENNKEYDNIVFVDDDMRHILKCSELEKDFKNFVLVHTLELVD
jgi:transketolase C-terminal domain/subunit